jgi:hypothetical protein
MTIPDTHAGTRMIPHEARDGLMRAWLAILQERHPDVAWIPVTDMPPKTGSPASEEITDLGTPQLAA